MIEVVLISMEIALVIGLLWMRRWKLRAFEYYDTKSTAIQREWLRLVGVEAYHYAERTFHQYDGPAKLNEAIKYVLDRAETQLPRSPCRHRTRLFRSISCQRESPATDLLINMFT